MGSIQIRNDHRQFSRDLKIVFHYPDQDILIKKIFNTQHEKWNLHNKVSGDLFLLMGTKLNDKD